MSKMNVSALNVNTRKMGWYEPLHRSKERKRKERFIFANSHFIDLPLMKSLPLSKEKTKCKS